MYVLSENPNAIHLLEQNIDKINWYVLSAKSFIFELDYKGLTERCAIYKEELIATAMHPLRYKKVLDYLTDNGISYEELDNYM